VAKVKKAKGLVKAKTVVTQACGSTDDEGTRKSML
jgi:hypothetical protein